MSSRHDLRLGIVFAFSVVVACSVSDECEPGTMQECTGDDECAGEQACGGNPGHWLACQCDEARGPVPSRVGALCQRDTDCEGDEQCLDGARARFQARFLGGAPSAPICTLRCEDEPERCERREPPAVCVVTDDRGTAERGDDRAHCLERCRVGDESDDKCQGDERLACATLRSFDTVGSGAAPEPEPGGRAGACRPLCASDADCSPERCNVRTGVCAGEPAEGDAFGAECDPSASEPTCAGSCVEVEGASFCSHRCWFGSVDDCGDASRAGLCRFPEEASGLIGDVGFCGLLCDADADCVHPELGCKQFEDSVIEAIVGRLGVCAPGGS